MKLSGVPACCTGMEANVKTRKEAEERDPLAERLADGDPSAPRDLVRIHYAELYRYALAILRDRPAAEDAVQAALEKALVALGGYPEARMRDLTPRPWLYKITLNVVRNKVRVARRGSHGSGSPGKPARPDAVRLKRPITTRKRGWTLWRPSKGCPKNSGRQFPCGICRTYRTQRSQKRPAGRRERRRRSCGEELCDCATSYSTHHGRSPDERKRKN